MKLASWEEAYGSQRPARGLAQGAELWIAANASGGIVGVAGGGPAADDDADTQVGIELQVLYVLASHHGTGLGERLMSAVLGDRDAVLWVLEHNPRARGFYEKHGFVADGRVEALAGDWAGLNEVRMVRRGANHG